MKQPLAFKLRPKNLDEIIGQQHLVGPNRILRKCVEKNQLFSMIFYGPSGTGKTTLAIALAQQLNIPHRFFNAAINNKKDLEAIFFETKLSKPLIVIIDEIHRLNKDKQDLLLPYLEDGSILLLGATTANPFHSINPALRSRAILLEVKPLSKEDVIQAIKRALKIGLDHPYQIEHQAIQQIANYSNGDIRYALNILDVLTVACQNQTITSKDVETYMPKINVSFDASEDGYYNALSAFQKSIRGSDVDAALFYLAYLALANDLESIERRLLVTAYEDIGLANPACVARTINAIDTAKRVGFPEALIPLGLQVIDLTLSPKSRSAHDAIKKAYATVESTSFHIPEYLKLTPVGLKENETYDYSRSDLWHHIQYLPKNLKDKTFYQPLPSSNYEKQLLNNYQQLQKYYRSNQLSKLYQEHKSPRK